MSGASALKAKLDSLKKRLKPEDEDGGDAAKKAKAATEVAAPQAKATAKLGARAKAAPSPPASPAAAEEPAEEEEVPPEPIEERDPNVPWVPSKKQVTPKGAGMKASAPAPVKPVPKAGESVEALDKGGLPIDKLRRLARFHCARHDPKADEADIIAAIRKVGVDNAEIEKTLEIAKPTAKAKPPAKAGAKAESKAGPKAAPKASAKEGAKKDDKVEDKEGDKENNEEADKANKKKRKWKPAFAVTEFEWKEGAAKQTISGVAAKAVSGAAPQLALPGPAGFNPPMQPPSAKFPSGGRPPFGGARPPPKATASSLGGLASAPAAPSAKISGAAAGLGARPKAASKAPSSSWATSGFPGGSPDPSPMGSPSGMPKEVCWDFAKGKCNKGAACKWSHDL